MTQNLITVLALIFAGLIFREFKPGRHIRVFIFANGVRLIYITSCARSADTSRYNCHNNRYYDITLQ